jgi:hypothetical protein
MCNDAVDFGQISKESVDVSADDVACSAEAYTTISETVVIDECDAASTLHAEAENAAAINVEARELATNMHDGTWTSIVENVPGVTNQVDRLSTATLAAEVIAVSDWSGCICSCAFASSHS